MLRLIFWILVGLLALSFFNISLQSIVNSPAGQENFTYMWHLLLSAWDWVVATLSRLVGVATHGF